VFLYYNHRIPENEYCVQESNPALATVAAKTQEGAYVAESDETAEEIKTTDAIGIRRTC